MIYYNEFDSFAASWLRELMKEKIIPYGEIDTRSITEVTADEIKGFRQCHFFAGIGGWVEALRIANWPTDRIVWTGSCPCQPFSSAGKQKGKSDDRHLWPVWFSLIRQCRPATIFGEQVSSAIAHGWLDDVYQGLEAEGYACGAAVLPACGVGAPHKRDRLFFVADSAVSGWQQRNAHDRGREGRVFEEQGAMLGNCSYGDAANAECQQEHEEQQGPETDERGWGTNSIGGRDMDSKWSAGSWILCPDGKKRLIEPGIRLLAHGVRNRVGKLRGYGNAIVPQVAAEFIGAYMDILKENALD